MRVDQERTSAAPVLVCKLVPNVQHGSVGIARSLGRLGIPVYGMVDDGWAPLALSRYVKGLVPAPGPNAERFLEAFTSIGRRLGARAVLIPTDDGAAVFIAEHAETLRQWFIFPRIAADQPRALADKASLYKFCQVNGITSPEYLVTSSANEAQDFARRVKMPVVVKANRHDQWLDNGFSSTVATSASQLMALFQGDNEDAGRKAIIQEYIRGQHWIFHGYRNAQTGCFVGFTGRKVRSYPTTGGWTTRGVSVFSEALMEQARALLEATSYSGIMDLDYRFDPRDRKYKIIDFNPRIGANFRLFETADGIDVVRAAYLDLTGQGVGCSPMIEGKRFVVQPHDAASAFAQWRRGELSVRRPRGLATVKTESAWWDIRDPLPAIAMAVRLLLRVAATRLRMGPAVAKKARSLLTTDPPAASSDAP
jgi:D-aspartate ligase